jgi:hypothetical protein
MRSEPLANSPAIRRNQAQSGAIRRNQAQSGAIRRNQAQSGAITDYVMSHHVVIKAIK